MRVLIIEDNQNCIQLLKELLSYEGYIVDIAYTGEEGERLAEETQYDCIILDIALPGKDGFAVCRSWRQKNIMVPVLMLTGKKDTFEDMVYGLDNGADDYMFKPFDNNVLLARVRALTRKSSPNKGSRLETGDIIIDTITKQVWNKQEEVMLTPIEYSLLEYLARFNNRNINRITLEQQILPLSRFSDVNSNILEAHVKNLRAKIDPDKRGLIKTIRGVGYRLNTRLNS